MLSLWGNTYTGGMVQVDTRVGSTWFNARSKNTVFMYVTMLR